MKQKIKKNRGQKKGMINLFKLTIVLTLVVMIPGIGQSQDMIDTDNLECGNLFLINPGTGEVIPSITMKTDVSINVTGIILRGRVVQYFTNQSDIWMEGIYMFPLPETAAVDTLQMKIDQRVITGEIKEKEEAKEMYEQAKKEGKKATLLEQQRPNIFNVSVAHIGPGETIMVMIEYQQSVEYSDGEFSFTFPMVVGPRYIPNTISHKTSTPEEHNPLPENDPEAITAPVDASDGEDFPISLIIHLDPGFPVTAITSPYLPITVEQDIRHRFTIYPQENVTARKRDFVLTWKPGDPGKTYTAVFHEQVNGNLYTLMMIQPQTPETITTALYEREVIIIIDTSGSMQGESIKQAKKALEYALDELNPGDRFNIIEFNTYTRSLFNNSSGVNYNTIKQAKSFVRNLKADHGTEMYPALVKALETQRDEERLFQVIFITDGCVGNEGELFSYIKKNIHNGRLFTVGIGSAPNHYFMRKAALVGRGTFLYIGSTTEVTEKMRTLFTTLAHPILTDISLSWSNSSAEILPYPVPDLYTGHPLIICTRSYLNAGTLDGRGSMGTQLWNQTFEPRDTGEEHNGISKLWARRKIEGLMDQLLDGTSEEEVQKEVTAIALEHHLVSHYTSLVAVEQIQSKPDPEKSGTEKLSQKLPHGWEMNQSPVPLPGAGTNMGLFLFIGSMLIAIALVFLVKWKKHWR